MSAQIVEQDVQTSRQSSTSNTTRTDTQTGMICSLPHEILEKIGIMSAELPAAPLFFPDLPFRIDPAWEIEVKNCVFAPLRLSRVNKLFHSVFTDVFWKVTQFRASAGLVIDCQPLYSERTGMELGFPTVPHKCFKFIRHLSYKDGHGKYLDCFMSLGARKLVSLRTLTVFCGRWGNANNSMKMQVDDVFTRGPYDVPTLQLPSLQTVCDIWASRVRQFPALRKVNISRSDDSWAHLNDDEIIHEEVWHYSEEAKKPDIQTKAARLTAERVRQRVRIIDRDTLGMIRGLIGKRSELES